MKKIKLVSSMLILALVTFLLGGCGANDKLFKAIDNNSNLKSYGFKGDYKVKISGKEAASAGGLENLDMKIGGKVVTEKDKNAKMDMNVDYNIMGEKLNINMISSVDLDKDDYKIFIKLPEELKSQMQLANKSIEYIYMGKDTVEKMNKEMGTQAGAMPQEDIKGMTESMTNLQEGLNEFVKGYVEENGKKMLTKQGKKDIDINGKKENVDVYEIKVDDAGLKKFLKSFLSDKKRKTQLETVLDKILVKDEKGKVDYKKSLENVDKMPKIIGDKGATFQFGIKDDYVVSEKVNMDLVLEGAQVTYDIDMVLFDLNKKMDIKMPEKNDKVKDLYDFMIEMIFNSAK
ncbi:hypothetical protein [Haloimpatiens massiliensis]|uniref:hypothetical protein n=1 Tax=Haloimpatiens massiliensis TaxID=1658110 RepID=UPI000C83D2E7|nr:hypothetical protein [Haloimpatiens massiliensis]